MEMFKHRCESCFKSTINGEYEGSYNCLYFQTLLRPLEELCRISLIKYNLAIFVAKGVSGEHKLAIMMSTIFLSVNLT